MDPWRGEKEIKTLAGESLGSYSYSSFEAEFDGFEIFSATSGSTSHGKKRKKRKKNLPADTVAPTRESPKKKPRASQGERKEKQRHAVAQPAPTPPAGPIAVAPIPAPRYNRAPWSAGELERLEMELEKSTPERAAKVIAKCYFRDPEEVRERIAALTRKRSKAQAKVAAARPAVENRSGAWTADEDALLRENARDMTAEQLCALLPNRKDYDIAARARELGLRTKAPESRPAGKTPALSGSVRMLSLEELERRKRAEEQRRREELIREGGWLPVEDERLRRNYPLHGTNLARWDSTPFGRSDKAIRERAALLGVRGPEKKPRGASPKRGKAPTFPGSSLGGARKAVVAPGQKWQNGRKAPGASGKGARPKGGPGDRRAAGAKATIDKSLDVSGCVRKLRENTGFELSGESVRLVLLHPRSFEEDQTGRVACRELTAVGKAVLACSYAAHYYESGRRDEDGLSRGLSAFNPHAARRLFDDCGLGALVRPKARKDNEGGYIESADRFVAAVYREHGFLKAYDYLEDVYKSAPDCPSGQYKTLVQEYAQARGLFATYRVMGVEGPANAPVYTCELVVGSESSRGVAVGKKAAETEAAAALAERLEISPPGPSCPVYQFPTESLGKKREAEVIRALDLLSIPCDLVSLPLMGEALTHPSYEDKRKRATANGCLALVGARALCMLAHDCLPRDESAALNEAGLLAHLHEGLPEEILGCVRVGACLTSARSDYSKRLKANVVKAIAGALWLGFCETGNPDEEAAARSFVSDVVEGLSAV